MNPWHVEIEINSSSWNSSQPLGCLLYCGNSSVDLCFWQLVDLISYSFFHTWALTWGTVLPQCMKNLQSVSKQPLDVTRELLTKKPPPQYMIKYRKKSTVLVLLLLLLWDYTATTSSTTNKVIKSKGHLWQPTAAVLNIDSKPQDRY